MSFWIGLVEEINVQCVKSLVDWEGRKIKPGNQVYDSAPIVNKTSGGGFPMNWQGSRETQCLSC